MSYVGRTEHVHNVQQNGGWCSYTLECVRNNVTSKKMQKKHYIPCRCMHERETVMQSGENPAMLVVCVCVKQFFTHTVPSEQNTRSSSFTWHDASLFLIFIGNCSVCECSYFHGSESRAMKSSLSLDLN